MSGDVQPKKRRDKRKKKEDQIEETVAHQQAVPTPTIPIDDTNIHVHKEKSIGGGICAKCIFFIITIAIAIIIGLTITEHRGLTDIDIPLSESRFASIFEGWIDTERSDDHDEGIESDEVSFDHDDDDSHEEEDDDEGVGSQEEEESTEETEQEDTQEEDEDEDIVGSEEEQEDSEEPEESPEQDESPEQEDDEGSPEQESQEEIEKSEEQESEEQEEQPVQSDEESQEQPTTADDDDDDEDNDEPDQPGSNEVEEDTQDDEPQEEIEDPQADGVADATSSGVAAKFGVGVALLIVAYVVLIKKWKSDKLPEEPKTKSENESPNLSRRNTLIAPPRLEEVEQDMDNLEEEYSEDEDIEESDEEIHIPASKRHYEELRATYTRSLTPEAQLGQTEEQYDEEIEEEEIEEEEEEYDEEREDVEYNDDEDEELMKKLEEKYGRIVKGTKYEDEEGDEEEEDDEDYDSWKRIKGIGDNAAGSESEDEPQRRSGAQSYELDNITNAYDYPIREDLDYAERQLQNNIPLALNLFIKILEANPDSPRALYGRARSLDHLAEKKRSNDILQESIKYFVKVLKVKSTPDALFLATADRCIDRMRFVGSYSRAIEVHNLLIERFPDDIKYRNDLSVTLLTINRITEARKLLLETLKMWPNNGFALVHYGFILKTVDNNLPLAIDYLTRGINTKEPGVVDGRFYFHLGDALSRSGQNDLAMKVYEDGVLQKVFLSKYQRSLYNVDRLAGRPWWSQDQTPYTRLFQLLQHHWRDIKKEGLDVLDKKGYFKDEAENLRDVGDWKQFELYARGVKNKENCRRCPLTCHIIDSFPEAKTCTRGQVKFSVMHPGTHVWPHCGPTNCRLRSHLGLKVPPRTYIRVAEEIRSWEEGKVFIFDDSFEHEVWHNGTDFRLVLIVDVWHPELTKSERSNLSPI